MHEVAVPRERPLRQLAEGDGDDGQPGRAAPFGPPGGERGVQVRQLGSRVDRDGPRGGLT
ncbi:MULTISPECIES: hypothetical protein [Streptomyces]|uniref:hypothetical protein n=1 Tax=Streptomyces alboflavus TaxID=67267 RepID=UPI000F658DAF|nr:hypothetical protein [Streptomyces alboflavus]